MRYRCGAKRSQHIDGDIVSVRYWRVSFPLCEGENKNFVLNRAIHVLFEKECLRSHLIFGSDDFNVGTGVMLLAPHVYCSRPQENIVWIFFSERQGLIWLWFFLRQVNGDLRSPTGNDNSLDSFCRRRNHENGGGRREIEPTRRIIHSESGRALIRNQFPPLCMSRLRRKNNTDQEKQKKSSG